MLLLAAKTVGVMGDGRNEHESLAREIGGLLARCGVNLLTGGGRGVMTSVSRAYTETPRQNGICIGVIPCDRNNRSTPKEGYPNRFVQLPIYTHLPYSGERGKDSLSRNHINILSCAAVIALPGGAGTAAEVSLALDYGKPILVYAPEPSLVEHFPRSAPRVTTIEAVTAFLAAHDLIDTAPNSG
jgi:uncharacterized protein (TIGR00725 family)